MGHLGGVDFIAVVPGGAERGEALARDVIAAFDGQRAQWLADAGAGDAGDELTMKAAVVPLAGVASEDQLGSRLAGTMRASKQQEGSTYVVWRPDLA